MTALCPATLPPAGWSPGSMGRASRLVSGGCFPAVLAAGAGPGCSGKGAVVPAAAQRQCSASPEGRGALGGCLSLHRCLPAPCRFPRHQGGGAGGADQPAGPADRQAGGQGEVQHSRVQGCPLGVPAAPRDLEVTKGQPCLALCRAVRGPRVGCWWWWRM